MTTKVKRNRLKLVEGRVVTAWAEFAEGPGWCNYPLWVLIHLKDGSYAVDCIQPNDQTAELLHLYRVSAAISAEMVGAVRRAREASRE